MKVQSQGNLTRQDVRRVVAFLDAMEGAEGTLAEFAGRGVQALPMLTSAELITLSICDLRTGRRQVISGQPDALSAAHLSSFDQFFFDHPLVRFHSQNPRGGAHRISDSLPRGQFQNSPLFNEYYRSIGIDHAIAVPLHVDGRTLVSFVLNRSKVDFTDRERDILEFVRRYLAQQYRYAQLLGRQRATQEMTVANALFSQFIPALTPRETEVLNWVVAGKTNPEIAAIVSAGVRTVQKHLEHIFTKLGVETRTAAAMRALAMRELH